MRSPKAKSAKRFAQINHIVDDLFAKLPSPAHQAVLVVCWRHATTKGEFTLSHSRIAEVTGLTRRYVIGIMDKLQEIGVIELVRMGGGVIPSAYIIKGVVNQGSLPPAN